MASLMFGELRDMSDTDEGCSSGNDWTVAEELATRLGSSGRQARSLQQRL
jgi:hypothetical protein